MIKRNLIWGYELSRSAVYTAEFLWLTQMERFLFKENQPVRVEGQRLRALWADLVQLLKTDSDLFAENLLPTRLLMPSGKTRHLTNLPRLILDGVQIALRKRRKDAHQFTGNAKKFFSLVPDYYRRNFHFQTDGYLSPKSADLYEHQVELLFAGGADPMRRLLMRPLRHHFGRSAGQGVRILELGAGTGSLTRFIKALYPDAKVTLVDLSEPYLKKAQVRLKGEKFLDFVQGDAAQLPFKDGQFDAVVSCFLFHELPQEIRAKVIQESARVLKPRGLFAMVDSLQKQDRPDYSWALDNFPAQFHEPFFKNYIQNPVEDLLKNSDFQEIKTDVGFFAKCLRGIKNESGSKSKSSVSFDHGVH